MARHEEGPFPPAVGASVALAPDGRRAWWIDAAGRVVCGALEPFERLYALPARGAKVLALDPGGAKLACRRWRGGIEIWGLATREPLLFLETPMESAHVAYPLAFSASGEELVAIWDGGSRVASWDLSARAGPRLGDLPGRRPLDLESRGGRRIAVVGEGADVALVDLASLQVTEELASAGDERVQAAAFAPDGRHFAWVGRDGHLHVRDLRRGADVLRVPTPRREIVALAFDPLAERLAVGFRAAPGEAAGLMVLGLGEAGRGEARPLGGHRGAVRGLGFGPGGRALLSACEREVRAWRLPGGEGAVLAFHEAAAGEAEEDAFEGVARVGLPGG